MHLGNKQTSRKFKQYSGNSVKVHNKAKITILTICFILFLFLIAGSISMGIGMFNGIIEDAPDIAAEDVKPHELASSVYDSNGTKISALVQQGSNRTNVKDYSTIPKDLINAFVAVEDCRYWEHNGIDLQGILRAASKVLTTGHFSEGASTITQQLIKNNVFSDWMEENSFGASLERKLQEQYLALKLEENMPKEDILLNYLNTINLGNNTLGIAAASKRYFGKEYSKLILSECVVLAAITNNPSRYNPLTNSSKNADRCEKILDDMQEQGYINANEKETALLDIMGADYKPSTKSSKPSTKSKTLSKANIASIPQDSKSYSDSDSTTSSDSPSSTVYDRIKAIDKTYSNTVDTYSYFMDELIEQVVSDLQTKRGYTESQAYNLVYSGGLEIHSTLDQDIQDIIDEEVNDESFYPKECRQYSCTFTLVVTHKDDTQSTYTESDLKKYYKEKEGSSFKLIKDTKDELLILIEAFKKHVTGKSDTSELTSINYTLQPQVSFVMMDQSTGYVKGISGGRGEKTTSRSLNRATNTTRQPGSLFKVLAAFAPAIDSEESTLASTYYDGPYTLNKKTFSNYWGDEYLGYSTIRQGIVYSMNIVTLKCFNETVTPQLGYDYLTNFGFTTLVDSRTSSNGSVYTDIETSLCLGGLTDGVTNLETTAAYAAIANGGEYTTPVFYTQIVDADGNILLDNTTPNTHRVIKDTTAYLLTNAMEEVMDGDKYPGTNLKGTGKDADVKGMTIAGKTGTTTSTNDIWFTGYSPYYTATIWSGYDDNSRISNSENYHKKIWSSIMTRVHKLKKLKDKKFTKPDGLVKVKICSKSGKLAVAGVCDNDPRGDMTYTEYFVKGTEPKENCARHTTAAICSASGQLATRYCPSSLQTTRVFMTEGIDDGKDAQKYSDDTEWLLSSQKYCSIHRYGYYSYQRLQ